MKWVLSSVYSLVLLFEKHNFNLELIKEDQFKYF
jgi:hypothetical protein